MAGLTSTVVLPVPVAEAFAFFARPRNLTQLAPDDWHLELVEGPEVLVAGCRTTWKMRRWGMTQRLVLEVTEFEENALLVEEQREGPLGTLRHARRFRAGPDGDTVIEEEIELEPPGGILGRLLGSSLLESEYRQVLSYREGKLREIFGSRA